jgi:hypothetical protein
VASDSALQPSREIGQNLSFYTSTDSTSPELQLRISFVANSLGLSESSAILLLAQVNWDVAAVVNAYIADPLLTRQYSGLGKYYFIRYFKLFLFFFLVF